MLPIPQHLKLKMEMYRMSLAPLPQGYIDHHADLAQKDLDKRDWHVLKDYGLMSEGWMDGMRVRQIDVVIDCVPKTLRWHESGAWFRDTGVGHVRYVETNLTWGEVAA